MDRKYPGNLDAIRAKSPSAYGDWTPEEDAELLAARGEGSGVADLARRFGRGANAVRSRLRHLYALRETAKPSEN